MQSARARLHTWTYPKCVARVLAPWTIAAAKDHLFKRLLCNACNGVDAPLELWVCWIVVSCQGACCIWKMNSIRFATTPAPLALYERVRCDKSLSHHVHSFTNFFWFVLAFFFCAYSATLPFHANVHLYAHLYTHSGLPRGTIISASHRVRNYI